MLFDYQLDRHCSKTRGTLHDLVPEFDYQLDRHCSKTNQMCAVAGRMFDYQLDRHCSKTKNKKRTPSESLITS